MLSSKRSNKSSPVICNSLSVLSFLAFLAITCTLALLVTAPLSWAASVALSWDASPDADLAGYRVFARKQGQSYNYSSPSWQGIATTCVIDDLVDNTTYCFVARTYNFSGEESSNSNEVCATIDLEIAPTANAGPDQAAAELTRVTLNGSLSSDSDGAIVHYTWTQVGGNSEAALSNAHAIRPTFTAPDVPVGGETLTFQLDVEDADGLHSTDTCVVTIFPIAAPPSLVTLSISGATQITENSSASYTATATLSDNSTLDVSQVAIWAQNSSWASIANGTITALEVSGDQPVIVSASYTYEGVTRTAQLEAIILNVPVSNAAPVKPVIITPTDRQTGAARITRVSAAPFSDPDSDTHSKSQWQLFESGVLSTAIMDISTSSNHLVEIYIPHATLKPQTAYQVRVRFFDIYNEPSQWSDFVQFTTGSSLNLDSNANGIPDTQEVSGKVDLNNNGVADIDEPEALKAVTMAGRSGAIAVAMTPEGNVSEAYVEEIEAVDPSTISDAENRPIELPFGLVSYRLNVSTPGATVSVTILFSEQIPTGSRYYMFDTIRGWSDYTQYVTFNEDGRSVTVSLQDGGHGDSDGVANGVIVDPSGIGLPDSSYANVDSGDSSQASAATSDGQASSSGGGCFIGASSGTNNILLLIAILLAMAIAAIALSNQIDRLLPGNFR